MNASGPRVAVYAGSFDPVTLGHVSVIERAAPLFDRLLALVASNPSKEALFSPEERRQMLADATAHLPTVECCAAEGLVVEFARSLGARILVRGVRSATDAEVEIALALANHALAPEIETVFVPARADLAMVSSSRLKELAREGADLSGLCPLPVARRLRSRLGRAPAEARR